MIGALDLVVFLASLTIVMAIGILAARRERTTEDFFLAGRSVRWWGVAGSIFGTNVSASQLVGMLGIGYSIGFAQSHFELGAIAALMLLAYGFLPVYRRLGAFTLSAWLGRRFDGRSQTLYAVISVVVTIVQLTGALYIWSRSVGLLLDGTVLDVSYLGGVVALSVITGTYTIFGGLKAVIYTDVMQSVLLLAAGVLLAVLTFAQPEVGGWSGMLAFDAARPVVEQKMHLYLTSSPRPPLERCPHRTPGTPHVLLEHEPADRSACPCGRERSSGASWHRCRRFPQTDRSVLCHRRWGCGGPAV